MKPTPLIWYDGNDDSRKCSCCHGPIDSLIKPIIIIHKYEPVVARFHPDCYEHYFLSANKYELLTDDAEWVDPPKSRQNSGFFGRW